MYRKAVLYMLLIGVLTLSPASGLLRWLGDQPTVQAWSEPTYTAPWSEGPLTNDQPGNESEEQVDKQQEEQEPEQGTGLWSEQLDLYPEQPVDEAMLDLKGCTAHGTSGLQAVQLTCLALIQGNMSPTT